MTTASLILARVWLLAVMMIAGSSFGQIILPKTDSTIEWARKHQAKLYWALRTRVLSGSEMAEVERLGIWLLVPPCPEQRVCSMPSQAELNAEFNAALLQQFRLRIAAEAVTKKEPCGGRPEPMTPMKSMTMTIK